MGVDHASGGESSAAGARDNLSRKGPSTSHSTSVVLIGAAVGIKESRAI